MNSGIRSTGTGPSAPLPRDMTAILGEIAGLADRASNLKKAALSLVAEIERDHIHCDDDTAWEIAVGARPSFLAFHLKGLLEVLADDVIDDLESALRGTLGVTDAQLLREWQERAGFIPAEELP